MTRIRRTLNRSQFIHTLKCWPTYFKAVESGVKHFELRVNDRNFQVSDTLILKEWNPITCCFTGKETQCQITYVLALKEYVDVKGWQWSIARRLMPNLVILSVSPLP